VEVIDGDITTRLGRHPFCIMCMTTMQHDNNHPKDPKGWTYEMARQFAAFYANWAASAPDLPRPRVRIFSIRTPTGWRYWAETMRRSKPARPPGDMHEPPPYPASSLEWVNDGDASLEEEAPL
jgi:hypothetical protein